MNNIDSKEWDAMMLKYKFAKTKLEADLEILLKEYEYKNEYNPVEHIKSRLKSERSILKKLEEKGYEKNVENIKKHIHDIVGIIKNSKTFKIINESDYIANPKDTGYTSYHLNVLVPVHLEEKLEYIEAEIQIRTVAMDFWASLDHKLQYKLPKEIPLHLQRELLECSDEIKVIDVKMQHLYEVIKKYIENNKEV